MAAVQVNAQTEDGAMVEIPQELIPQLTLISNTLSLSPSPSNPFIIPLPKVSSSTLARVLDYARLHLSDPNTASSSATPVLAAKPSEPRIKLNLSGPRAQKTGEDDANDDDDDDAESDGKDSSEDASASDDDDGADSYLLEELDNPVTPADRKFTEALDLPVLIELTTAANYLAMEPLLDLCCKTIAGHMIGLSTEELRAKFGIVNDFTPEEEAKMKAEFGWADEK